MPRKAIWIAIGIAIVATITYFMDSKRPYSKTIFDMGDEGTAAAIHLPIEPYGTALFVAPDSTADSARLVDEVASVWPELWPKMSAYLATEMKDYNVEAVLGRDEFIGSLGRMTKDVFMGDQSDIMIRLEFEHPPLWDFFVRGSTIAHSQPVF